jgi:hypothetical protein
VNEKQHITDSAKSSAGFPPGGKRNLRQVELQGGKFSALQAALQVKTLPETRGQWRRSSLLTGVTMMQPGGNNNGMVFGSVLVC